MQEWRKILELLELKKHLKYFEILFNHAHVSSTQNSRTWANTQQFDEEKSATCGQRKSFSLFFLLPFLMLYLEFQFAPVDYSLWWFNPITTNSHLLNLFGRSYVPTGDFVDLKFKSLNI